MNEKLREKVADLIEAGIDSVATADQIIPLIRQDERETVFREIGDSFTENFEAGEGIVLYISKLKWQALKQR